MSRLSRRRGFTLIELVIVIGVILIIISLLLPAVGRVWESANATKCQANLKTLSGAFISFAKDHDGHLPGSVDSFFTDTNPQHMDWLQGPYTSWMWWPPINLQNGQPYGMAGRIECAPQYGTLWPYVNSYSAYLCPSLSTQQPGVGTGSNGRFDYFAFDVWSGAAVTSIAPYSQLHFPLDPNNPTLVIDTNPVYATYRASTYVENHPTPLVAQEDALVWSNTYADSWYQSCRQMAHCHFGGSYYAAIDGSVNFINEPDTDPTNLYGMGESLWWQNGPTSGIPRCLNFDAAGWGYTTSLGGTGWGAWSHY